MLPFLSTSSELPQSFLLLSIMSVLREAETALKASEAEWDVHKENIRRLYCIEDRELKGPRGVQEEMGRLYQFHAE